MPLRRRIPTIPLFESFEKLCHQNFLGRNSLVSPSRLHIQIEHHLFTPELNAAIDEQKRASRQKQRLFGETQRVTKEQLLTKRAMRRLNHIDDTRGKV